MVIDYTSLYLKHGWILGSQSYKSGSHLLKTCSKLMVEHARGTAKKNFPFQFRRILFPNLLTIHTD